MIEAIKLWNEPNNISHWDFTMDLEWREFGAMIRATARALKELCPALPLVLGDMSPIDPNFLKLMTSYGALNEMDAVAVHGFPLDWNPWKINAWPEKIAEIEAVTDLPV